MLGSLLFFCLDHIFISFKELNWLRMKVAGTVVLRIYIYFMMTSAH